MKVGDIVKCIDIWPESSWSLTKPLELNCRYKVLDVRDAGFCPPKGDVPDEIKVRTDHLGLAMWYGSYRFKLSGEETT